MSFIGCLSKSLYLIWKQNSDGFFTALDKNGLLSTWSTVTGKLLWVENQNTGIGEITKDASFKNMRGYDVYKSDVQDTTYMTDYYQFDNAID